MKYWIGYLVAAIFGAIGWAFLQMAERFTVLVDMVFPYVTRTLQDVLAQWSGGVDFLLWQVLLVALAVIAVALLVLTLIFRWNPIRWLGWVLAAASFVFLLHSLVFGLNYHAGSIADDVRMDMVEYSVSDLAEAAEYYRDQANKYAVLVERDAEGNVKFAPFGNLAETAADGFKNLVYDWSYPVFAGCRLPVKELGWADMYTSMGITGVTVAITGEAAVNPQIPAVSLPFTMCHEMAHRMSIATESDANFAAYLACQANENVEFLYSGYFMAYRYCYSSLAAADPAAAATVNGGACTELADDMFYYTKFFSDNRDDKATELANSANDTYLKTSGDDDGIASYGNVTDLLVNWYIHHVIMPTVIEEAPAFDPFDESQVDLTDLAGSRVTQGGSHE